MSKKKPSKNRAHGRGAHPRSQKTQHSSPIKKATARDWIAAARIRTLPVAIAPVALGTGIGIFEGGVMPWRPLNAVLCLVIALALQIGVNYANDYSDGVRGTDSYRIGPARLTGSGAAKPRKVLQVALIFFALAAIAGVTLVVLTGAWWLLAVGALALIAAWFYTGGKRPYGYYGLGELSVFLFFGLVATVGSAWAQSDIVWSQSALVSGAGVGLLACAVLMVNNVRDIDQDRLAGKRTLAVILGARGSRVAVAVFTLLPFAAIPVLTLIFPAMGLVYFVLLLALPTVVIVGWARTAQELILALQLSSLTTLAYGLGVGLIFAL